MNRILLCFAMLGALAAPAYATARSPLEGRWKNGKMEIVIAPCGRELCGTVVKASPKAMAKAQRGSGTDLIGARLIKDIEPAGPNRYKGRVFVADRNMHASGTIRQLNRNQLAVRGCLLGVICKSATWDRVN